VPVLAGDACVVEFAGEDFEGFAVEEELVALNGEAVGGGWLSCGGKGGEGEQSDNGETGSWLHERREYRDDATLVHLGECFKGRTWDRRVAKGSGWEDDQKWWRIS
jgi:hypothetical protein